MDSDRPNAGLVYRGGVMAREPSEAVKSKIKEVVEYFIAHDAQGAERLLTDALMMFGDEQDAQTIRREAWVRFNLSCRGCGKELFKHTEKIPVMAGQAAPTLTLSTGLDPHTCERKAKGLFA